MNMQELFEKAMLVGVGVLSLTREKAEAVVDDLVKRGEVRRNEAESLVDRLAARGEEEREALRCAMDRRQETPTVPYISVVIPAYNEEKYLLACLSAVRQQEDAPPHEIIVVDNASTDGTAHIARRCGVRVVTEPRKGVARARQTGFEAACGEIIASTDADTCVTPFWLARLAAHFRDDPALGAVYGPVRWHDGRPVEQWALQYPVAWVQWLSHRAQRDLWWGSNFAVRHEVFWKAGGFPVDWPTGEDTDLSLRVSRIARVCFDPGLVVYASSRRAQEGWVNLGRHTLTDVVERFVLRRPPSLPMADLR